MESYSNSIQKGDALELRVRDLLQTEIDEDRFWAKKSSCKVFHKKGYYSRDRNSNIVFDVSIEVYLPGEQEYSLLVLIECKNYSNSVPVNDIEELFSKVQQVAGANAKAVLASNAAFQAGTLEFAKSKKIALMRCLEPDGFKWELKRSASSSARPMSADMANLVEAGFLGQGLQHSATDVYLQSPARLTSSLWDFFDDIALDSGLTRSNANKVSNSRNRIVSQVAFHKRIDLENRAAAVHSELEYAGGIVPLEKLCQLENERTGLKVNLGVPHPSVDDKNPILGRIQFEPLVIDIYAQENENPERSRFTLAHELAHHLLGHGKYLIRESCDASDFSLARRDLLAGSDIARMEYQANLFAACLLLPRALVIEDFLNAALSLDLLNKKFRYLYVDDQPCNVQNYTFVTGQLMRKYGVSRTAAKIRLEALGLLRDARQNSLKPVTLEFDIGSY